VRPLLARHGYGDAVWLRCHVNGLLNTRGHNRYAGVGAGGDQSPSMYASSRSCGGAVQVDLASWAGRVVFAELETD
jgi:hypothetical protein